MTRISSSAPARGRSTAPSRGSNNSTSRGSAPRGAAPRRPAPVRRPANRPRSIWDELPVQVVPTENLRGFADLGLPSSLVAALGRAGIPSPFPIQAAVIPDILAGRDVLGRAATGSGKTLAFGLPLIARLDGATSNPAAPPRPDPGPDP